MNFKKIVPIFIALTAIIACNKDDDNAADNFDAAAQAVLDDATLVDYLKSHYYIPATESEVFGTVDTILNNEMSLYDRLGDDLKVQEIEQDAINYKLYYFLSNVGVNDNPTRYDSIFIKYRGFTLDSVRFDENTSFNTPRSWLNMAGGISSFGLDSGVIQGWKYGMPKFNSGTNITTPGEPITFENTGKGILFIPSGLAYGNIGSSGISPNTPLLFHIELGQVIRADNDNDGILNKNEDINKDGEVIDDDTDGDGLPDFVDTDDDNDGVSTRDELDFNEYIINIGDTDPVFASNEFEIDRVKDIDANTITISTVILLDSNNDGTPDYLDADTN